MCLYPSVASYPYTSLYIDYDNHDITDITTINMKRDDNHDDNK